MTAGSNNSRIAAVTMPKWGIEMTEGTLNAWTAVIGQSLNKGDGLLDVETDKIVNTVEAPSAGTLRRTLASTGDVIAVGALLAVLAPPDVSEAQIDQFIANFKGATVNFEPESSSTPVELAPNNVAAADGEPRVSPIARRVAQRLGVDVTLVVGSGRNGRVSKDDVEAFAARTAAAGNNAAALAGAAGYSGNPETRSRMSSMRATIARRLMESAQTIPHYRLIAEVDAGRLILKKGSITDNTSTPISVNDMLIRACSLALLQHPIVNAQLQGDELVQFQHADIAFAVATESGLIAPIVRRADTKTAAQIARETTDLAARAVSGRLTREEITGGTFTISNLGMHGVTRFDGIINLPQVAILAVGRAEERVVARDGHPAVARMMTLTLSLDHRVIDGAVGAAFLNTLSRIIEKPDPI